MRTPYHLFRAAAEDAPDTAFLLLPKAAALPYAPDGRTVTYARMAADVERLRAAYAAAGYGKGHIAALAMDNRPEFFAHFLALNALDVAVQPINPDLRPDELAHQFSIAPPDLGIALPERQPAMIAAGLPSHRMAGEDIPAAPAAGTVDACALLFTSGSTGKPKCCVLSNEYFVRLAEWYVDQGKGAAMSRGEVILTPLPLFHMNALGCSALGAMLLRGTLVPVDRFSASRWWDTVAESRASVVHYLGVMPAILLKLPEGPRDRAHSVRFGFGAGVDPRHQTTFEDRFGFPLIEAWAMTETGGAAVTTTAPGDRHVARRCVGYPCAGLRTRLVDDSGNDADEGELLVRREGDPRHGFFSGYLGNESATEEAWKDGWFHTGDIMRREGEALFFVDRKKNIVRRSGENIAVVDVEGVLANLPGIAAVAVAPIPDDIRGEEVMALVIADGPADHDTAMHIARASAASLAYHKVPGWIAFVQNLPTTATQKLQRAEIRRLAADSLATAHDLRDLKAALRKAVV
ncbi:AMP-binding protein [Falsirhodobacter sp. 1013]|uniref:AMP-binding protein n=1 Tax=Falsirhodobacter sp. 1013 TaxID=3417566 RepID=UPI003EB8ABCC